MSLSMFLLLGATPFDCRQEMNSLEKEMFLLKVMVMDSLKMLVLAVQMVMLLVVFEVLVLSLWKAKEMVFR